MNFYFCAWFFWFYMISVGWPWMMAWYGLKWYFGVLIVVICEKFPLCTKNFRFRVSNWGFSRVLKELLNWLCLKGIVTLIMCIEWRRTCTCSCGCIGWKCMMNCRLEIWNFKGKCCPNVRFICFLVFGLLRVLINDVGVV